MSRLRASEVPVVRPPDVEEGSVVTVFRVPREVAGQRVDVFLQGQFRRSSRTRAKVITQASAYDDSGRRLRPGSRVLPEQIIVLWRAPWDENPVPRDIPIVYEDEHLLAVNKPAHLPVHPTARYHKNTLIMLLKAARPDQWLTLGHRIDRETSGLLLVPKHPECDRRLKKQLEERNDIGKSYVALTWGVPQNLTLGVPYRHVEAMCLDEDNRYNVKMKTTTEGQGLHAATVFTLEEVARSPLNGAVYSRVRCDLETGRQHQIRVHLRSLGAPIVGDKLYGPDEGLFARSADGELTEEDVDLLELPRHALHAARLRLEHPMTGQPLELEAEVPNDLADFWRSIAG